MTSTLFHLLFLIALLSDASILIQAMDSQYPLCSGPLQQDKYNNALIPVGGDLYNCTIVAAVSTSLNFACVKPHDHLHFLDNADTNDTSTYSAVWYTTINGDTKIAGLSLQTGSLEFVLNIDSEYLNQVVTVQCGLCLYDPSKGATDCERLHIHGFYPIQLSEPVYVMAFDSPHSLESEVNGLSVTLSWSPSTPQYSHSDTSSTLPFISTTASYKVFIEAIRDGDTVAIFEMLSKDTFIIVRSCDLQEKLFADTYEWSVVKIVAGKASLNIKAEEEFQFNRTMPCEKGDTRLVDGANCNEGRVEICLANNTWGTVCDDFWNEFNSNVVCDSLGIPGNAVAKYFGPGEDDEPIALDDVRCYGNETNLIECQSRPYFLNCNHFEDVGVVCGLSPQCNDGEIRLIDGDALNAGRIEVCQLNVWGTVCDDRFTLANARVACRQLGFKDALTFIGQAHYGPGYGSIVMDEVSCTGTESSLFNCRRADFHDCDHFEDVSVVCEANCVNGEVRLAAGGTDRIMPLPGGAAAAGGGLVEVCLDNGWGFLYDSEWSDEDAMVICSQLKIDSTRVLAVYGAGFQLPKNITRYAIVHHYSVECTGEETMIRDCELTKRRRHSQGYVVDIVGVMCEVTLTNLSSIPALQPSSSVITVIDTLTSTAVIVGAVGALIVITVVNILVVGLAVCLIYRKNRATKPQPNPAVPYSSPASFSPSSNLSPTRPIYINKVLPKEPPSRRGRNNYTDNVIPDSGIDTTVFGSNTTDDVSSSSTLEEVESGTNSNDEYVIILADDPAPAEGNESEYATLRNNVPNNAESAETTGDDEVYSVPVIPNGSVPMTTCCNRGKTMVSHQSSTQSGDSSIVSIDDIRRGSKQPLVARDDNDEVYSYPDDYVVAEIPSHSNTPAAGHQPDSTVSKGSDNAEIVMVRNDAYDVGRQLSISTDSTAATTGVELSQNERPCAGENVPAGEEKRLDDDHPYYNQISTPNR